MTPDLVSYTGEQVRSYLFGGIIIYESLLWQPKVMLLYMTESVCDLYGIRQAGPFML